MPAENMPFGNSSKNPELNNPDPVHYL